MKTIEIAKNSAEILWPKNKNDKYVKEWWERQGFAPPVFDWGLVH